MCRCVSAVHKATFRLPKCLSVDGALWLHPLHLQGIPRGVHTEARDCCIAVPIDVPTAKGAWSKPVRNFSLPFALFFPSAGWHRV